MIYLGQIADGLVTELASGFTDVDVVKSYSYVDEFHVADFVKTKILVIPAGVSFEMLTRVANDITWKLQVVIGKKYDDVDMDDFSKMIQDVMKFLFRLSFKVDGEGVYVKEVRQNELLDLERCSEDGMLVSSLDLTIIRG